MRHARNPVFDDLEGRQLLSTVHHAALPQDTAGPLELDGTLTVDARAAKVSLDDFGDQTTETPVSGVLGGLGLVHGTWDESADINGAYLGPDTIRLHNSRGSFVIEFDDTTFGQGIPTAQGRVYDVAHQQLQEGTGAFVRASEAGLIRQTTDAKETTVESFTLTSNRSS